MLSHARGLLRAYSLQREEAWPNQKLEPGLRLLKRSRVTVLGFGHIGSHVGRLVKSFGAAITGLRRNPGAKPDYFTEEDRLLPADRLAEVLPETDHLVLCLPAASETTSILDGEWMALLPQRARRRRSGAAKGGSVGPSSSRTAAGERGHRYGASHANRGAAGFCECRSADRPVHGRAGHSDLHLPFVLTGTAATGSYRGRGGLAM